MHASLLLFLSALAPTLTLSAVLKPRAITHPTITSLTVSGSGCFAPQNHTIMVYNDPNHSAFVGFSDFISNDRGVTEECTIVLNYDVVIPSDGNADLEVSVATRGFFYVTDPNIPGKTAQLTQEVVINGETYTDSVDYPYGNGPVLLTQKKFTISGAAGETVSGVITAKVTPTAQSSDPNEPVDQTSMFSVGVSDFYFYPYIPIENKRV